MKRLVVLCIAALALPSAALAQRVGVTLAPGRTISFNFGCRAAPVGPDRWPTTVYDAQTHDRISYRLSSCLGGFVNARNEVSGRHWDAYITPDGVITGRDIDGHRWRYDPHARLYTNLDTHRTCAQTSVREVCVV